MHITVDLWLEDLTIEPNFSATGISITPTGEAAPKVTLFFGTSTEAIEASRKAINAAVDKAIEARSRPIGEGRSE